MFVTWSTRPRRGAVFPSIICCRRAARVSGVMIKSFWTVQMPLDSELSEADRSRRPELVEREGVRCSAQGEVADVGPDAEVGLRRRRSI